MQSGSGTTGRGANLIFLAWVRLESSSEGRTEGPRAGELGRDLEELRGETLRRIDCKVGFAMVLWGEIEEGEEEEVEEEEMEVYPRSLNIEISNFCISTSCRIIP